MKTLNINKYPETVNGMKTRLFAQYINWFNKTIPASSFNFQYFMSDRSSAIKSLKNEIVTFHEEGIKEFEKLGKSVLKRMNTKTKSDSIPCGSVGCFTGWAKECKFMFSDKELGSMDSHNINTDRFSNKVRIDHNLGKFIFMPDCFYRVQGIKGTNPAFVDLGNAGSYITKTEMLERCVKFLDYVVNGDIDPNPLAQMSEKEALS